MYAVQFGVEKQLLPEIALLVVIYGSRRESLPYL